MKYKIMDGNEACTYVSYRFTEIAGIYPITPASPMAEFADQLSTKNVENFFGSKVKVIEMQSESGAAGMVHGSLQSGCLTTTYTASQGLLLMIPNMYKIAGEMLPCVINVAARSLATHALSIFGDHQDIYACRQTGFAMLASSSVQQVMDLTAVAHLSTIKGRIPIVNFFDGFRTSHELNKIKIIDLDKVKELIDYQEIDNFRNRAMTSTINTRGTAQNEDIYFQNTEVRNNYYNKFPNIVNSYMSKINEICDTNYLPFNYYGSKTCKYLIIAMGSVCETIKETIDTLNKNEDCYGLIEVHLYRPFSEKYLLNVFPKTVEEIAVLDRTKEPGSDGEPLYKDIVTFIQNNNIKANVYGGRYGLSSKNTTPSDIYGVYNALKEKKIKNNFTISIEDDITNLSIEPLNIDMDFPGKEIIIYGYGSDGMVGASKDFIKIIGDNTENYAQGYFQYDSKKSGGLTKSFIRISNEEIHKPYYTEKADLIVISKDSYIDKYDCFKYCKDNTIILINSDNKEILNKVKINSSSKIYIIDANKIARDNGLDTKISMIMENAILYLTNIIEYKNALQLLKDSIINKFGKKGNSIADKNIAALNDTINNLHESNYNYKKEDEILESDNIYQIISKDEGYNLKVSAFLDHFDGIFEGGTSKFDKRRATDKAPRFNKENCIGCNMCSLVCPHGVIRPFVVSEDEEKNLSQSLKEQLLPLSSVDKNNKYLISASIYDCTGCKLCTNICPGKNGNKALTMTDIKELDKAGKQLEFNYLEKNISEKEINPISNVRNSQFRKPLFTFSGACAGCGETPYLKLITQLFGENIMIANATGCSSIYSASMPTTAYEIPWANSLFEDNAEFGYGMKVAEQYQKERVNSILINNKELINSEILNNYLTDNNKENSNLLLKEIEKINNSELNKIKKQIPKKSIFIVGGDGWAYDIGFSGIDHVLSTNENVNIIVLDTEVYSNTGGQSSKSSRVGSVAKFTANGKENNRKDLAKIALTYPHVYVATIALGANMNQAIKVLIEAEKYDGPSLIIAYSPCISHGILTGMQDTIAEEKLAVESGYFPLFHYNPITNEFKMDCKVDFNKYDEFLKNEDRYRMLKNISPEKFKELLERNKQNAIDRYNYYLNLENDKK